MIATCFVVLGMTYKVGRQRGGRESVAHSSARRERVAKATIPKRCKGKKSVGSSSETQVEAAHDIGSQHLDKVEAEYEAQHVDEVEAEYEAQHVDEVEGEYEAHHMDGVEAEMEAEVEQPQPPSPPQPYQQQPRKRNTRTTQGQNPPPIREEVVTEFGGGPTDLSLLPSFGKHVAAALWKGQVSLSPLNNNRSMLNNLIGY
jgi:hypothetical protein